MVTWEAFAPAPLAPGLGGVGPSGAEAADG